MKTLIIIFFISSINLFAQTIISGRIFDSEENPLPFVNVYVANSTDGSVSDSLGYFKFKTYSSGNIVLIASMIGFKKIEKELAITGDKIVLNLMMEPEIIELDKAIVLGSSFSNVKGKGVVLSKIDILTTPGGTADIFQSLKTLPGLTSVNESAELYVRGGDPFETVTLLDNAPVNHPYTLESTRGGLFSKIKTENISNLYFSSGGFSAKYGNVLSGVVDIQPKSEVISDSYNLGVSMAELSGNIKKRIDDKLSFILSFSKSYTKILSYLFLDDNDFRIEPGSESLYFSGNFNLNEKSSLKFIFQHNSDNQEVKVERPEITGYFKGNSSNNIYNFFYSNMLSRSFLLKANFSFTNFKSNSEIGNFDISNNEHQYQSKINFIKFFKNKLELNFGLDLEKNRIEYIGKIPKEEYDLKNHVNTQLLNDELNTNHTGIYVELKKENFLSKKNLSFIFGTRYDKVSQHSSGWLDYRIGAGYKLGTTEILKLSYGTFHQNQFFRYLSNTDGNPKLKPMFAEHLILNYTKSFPDAGSFQAEAYYKNYKNLPLENDKTNYSDNGYGYSYGFDFIYKRNFSNIIEGWLSYGYINTKRKWKDYETLSRSEFDITHNLSLILKYNINFNWQLGLNLAMATGKPFTPVVNRNYIEELDLYKPIYGNKNSAHLTAYNRVDLRILHFTKILDKYFTVIYLEGLNIFNTPNIIDYTYNFDYSEKKGIKSYFGERMFVLGFSINLK